MRGIRRGLVGLAALVMTSGGLLGGCRNQPLSTLLPLSLNRQWTYDVGPVLQARVRTLTVSGRVPVSRSEGWRLETPEGESHLVWEDGQLLASQWGGVRFTPPLILIPATEQAQWTGTMGWPGAETKATASITRNVVQELWRGSERDLHEVIHTFQGENSMRIDSAYLRGVGLIRQDVYENDLQVRRLRLLARDAGETASKDPAKDPK